MRIASVRIQNLRSFDDETILLDNYTCLVGPNGSGKSAILCALNIVFRETKESPTSLLELEEEDFHGRNTDKPIIITVTFVDLPKEAQEDFKDYYRQGELVVSAKAEFDSNTKVATVRQYGQRKGMEEFRRFFEADKRRASADDLKTIYSEIRAKRADLPNANTKAKMIEALRTYEEDHSELNVLIPSEDEFYGFTKGSNRLGRWVQWIFVPAVKDASREELEGKDTALGKLLQRTVRSRVSFENSIKELREETQQKYQKILDSQQGTLNDISASLKKRFAEWAHPDTSLNLKWQQDPETTVRIQEPFAEVVAGEGAFTGRLVRFGHGFQRSYLLVLLQELAGTGNEGWPRLILGCEEPELYQHPPQCKHLAQVLQELCAKNSQAIVSSHSPYFVAGKGSENVRMVRKDSQISRSKVTQLTFEDLGKQLAKARENDPPKITEGTLAKIHQALQPAINEIFFTNQLVLLEGREDAAYLTTYLTLMDLLEDIRRMGFHFVPTDGKNHMLIPLAIARHMGTPTFIIFDSDRHKPEKNGSREMHRKDNSALLRLAGITNPDPFPADNFWASNVAMWKSEMQTVVAEEITDQKWGEYKAEVSVKYGHEGGLDKNPLFIADVLERSWKDGTKSPTLVRLCEEIIKFGKMPG